MKRSYITIMSIVVSLVLVGLIAMQLYWINNAITLKEQQFDRSVKDAMNAVVRNLEKEEAITQITKKIKQGKDLFESFDTLQSKSGLKLDSLIENQGYSPLPPAKNDSTELIIKKTSKQYLHAKNSKGLNISFPESNDSLSRRQWLKKSYLIRDIVNELAFISISKQVEDRVDLSVIDSLLKVEFKSRGITTSFEFDIYDRSRNKLLLHDEKGSVKEILNSGFRVSLFPNDYLIESDELMIYFPDRQSYILKNMWLVLTSSAVLILIIIGAFSYTIRTIVKQKKLSEIKNDFISNMTHELKTPISTISLAAEALADNDLARSKESRNNYLSMISDENKRLGLMVENVLKSALWDKKDFRIRKEKIDLNALSEEVCESFRLRIEQKNGRLIKEISAEYPIIEGDRVHITNIIYNLLDNAVKYTPEEPEIKIGTATRKDKVVISVEDNGIGMSKEVQNKIFEKFYRVPTGNVHNVKGFGLGLNYVKAITEKHGGSVEVKSQPGKGSAFRVILPIKNNSNE